MSDGVACRILTISPSAESAFHFIDRVKAHPDVPKTPGAVPEDRIVQWTINNKYYSADVHFDVKMLNEWHGDLAYGVPAVLFVWRSGESYREQIERFSEDLTEHEPEVALAVKLPGNPDPDGHTEEDADADNYFSTHGLEFVDASLHVENTRAAENNAYYEGVPGLARVIDALSTIMWPSMVQAKETPLRRSRARELLDWAQDEDSNMLASDNATLSTEAEALFSHGTRQKTRRQREMEELKRWLEEDVELQAHDDPWATATSTFTTSPPPADDLTTFSAMGAAVKTTGFDDDFTVFVSAPPEDLSAGRSSPVESHSSFEGDRLDPMHTGASYLSLGSDFGGNQESDYLNDQGEPELPSHAEIEATTLRLFGPITLNMQPPSLSSSTTGTVLPTGSSTTSTSTASSIPHAEEYDDGEDSGDYETSPFDLSHVLSALQTMKEEIAGMEDDNARRRAAARVALGLVYGLERDTGRDGETLGE